MVYSFEFLKFVRGRDEPVVARVASDVLPTDDAAKARASRLLLGRAEPDGVFACRILRENAGVVATIVAGVAKG